MPVAVTTATITSMARAMSIDGLLPLLWLASPALPVGGFSYSEGLESAVDAGRVADETQAREWLVQQLHLVLARSELPVVKRAIAAWRNGDHDDIRALNDWVLRTRETSEFRQQSVQMGKSMTDWIKAVRAQAVPAAFPICWPVAWSLAASSSGAEPRDALAAFAFAWSENMVQAAVRAVPLGQSAGQRILLQLAKEIPHAVDEAWSRDEPQAFSPMLAILSSRHESQYSRLFRS
jgi:urease accessory protein